MAKKMLFLFVLLLSLTGMLKAQVTTAGMSGKVMADEESVIASGHCTMNICLKRYTMI